MAFETPSSQGESPQHEATAKECYLCWRHKMAGEEHSNDLREEFNFTMFWETLTLGTGIWALGYHS